MLKFVGRAIGLFTLLVVSGGDAGAQQAPSPLNLGLGDAVVTGFSGTVGPSAGTPIPRNKSAIDLTLIDPNGASAEILDLASPGRPWDASVTPAPKKLRVTAGQVGQVFGVAIGERSRPDVSPNIYLGATSVFGLQISHRTPAGVVERLKTGAPGAQWAEGQFGLGLQGGPGAIYTVDGATGAVTLLANVMLDGVPNPGPGLGNLAYDSAHKQLFASDLYTGMIHRIGLDGADLGHLDHGGAVRPAAQLPPAPFDPRRRVNIASNAFDANNPGSWTLAPAARQVWAVAVNQQRLYYSVLEGPQIWSVGIQPNGDFATDARLEVDLPAQPNPLAVTDIAFSPQGAMVVAQRNAYGSGFYDYSAFTAPGEPRVLRFWPKKPNDPPSPGLWSPVPEEIPVGFAGNGRNANGGVAFGYGYDPNGAMNPNACGGSLLVTGENLRLNASLRDRLAPGGPLSVDGLQISPGDIVRDPNAPQPWMSYFVDYDGKFSDGATPSGSQGVVRTLTAPCPPAPVQAGPTGAGPAYIAGGPGGGNVGGNDGGGNGCVGPNCGDCDRPDCCDGRNCNTLIVLKEVVNKTPTGNLTGYTYPVAVTCSGMPVQNLTLHFPNQIPAQTINNIPNGATCSVAENTVGWPVPANACPPRSTAHWLPPVISGPVTFGASPQTITVTNTLVCEGFLVIDKKVIVEGAAIAIPSSTTFAIRVDCGGVITNMNLPDNGSQTVTNIPFGTSCLVTETPPTTNICPPGTIPVWTKTITPPPNPVVISGAATARTVTNKLVCDKREPGTLTVIKNVENKGPLAIPASTTYAITVNCGGAITNMNLPNGGSQTVNNIPATTSCTVSETPPTLNVCPPRMTPHWSTSYSPWSTGNVPPSTTVTVLNVLTCDPVDKTCAPPLVMNAAGECVCPPDTHMVNGKCVKTDDVCKPPLVMNPAGDCVCPPDTHMVNGTCVKTDHVCKPPQVMNAAGECVCPAGTHSVGGRCAPDIKACKPPLVMNAVGGCVRKPIVCPANTSPSASGRSCVCDDGMVRYRGTCQVPAHRKERGKPIYRQRIICEPPTRLVRGVCVAPRQKERAQPRGPAEFPRIPGIFPGRGGGGNAPGPRGGGGAPGRL
jgi:hypothetical protein